ncbi:MAG: MBL fold metallo-hydrolase [Planctomycetes bacterium]|nr:MBL fold metallo-hydrolase [Planctomycetota bacterium]
MLDAGEPLNANAPSSSNLVPGTLDISRPVDAVIVSHPHLDHFGLLRELPGNWPVWCGAPTEALMRLTVSIAGDSLRQSFRNFKSFKPFTIGPFKVTAFLTDHSAFDAHMLLVEVGGKSVFYSGDFRRSGRKSYLVDKLVKSPPRDVDVLLLEGTTLGRVDGFKTESDLENEFVSFFSKVKGRVFISWSAQNIDRTVTIYRACKRSGRNLVLDVYSIDILEQLNEFYKTLPNLDCSNLDVVITSKMKWLYENEMRINKPDFIKYVAKSKSAFSAKKLGVKHSHDVIMLRDSLMQDFERAGLVLTNDDAWIFSMWSGYLKQPALQSIKDKFDSAGAMFEQIHTSGHASLDELQKFASSIDARFLVPIHSYDWDKHLGEFQNVHRLQDGESFEIA